MKTKLIGRRNIAEGTTEIILERPGSFQFKPGQYAQVIIPSLDEGNRREFSMVSSPNDKQQLQFAFRDSESSFKKKILELEIGSDLEIEGPYGLFTLQQGEGNIVLIAGGIGITPFMSMARYLTEEKAQTRVTLITINSSEEKTPFKEDLERLEADNRNLKIIQHIGRQSLEKVFKAIQKDVEKIYVAGPPSMVSEIKQELIGSGVDEEKILAEDFIGYA